MRSASIHPFTIIQQLGLFSKINKLTLRFEDKVVDSSFNESKEYMQSQILKFFAIPTIPIAIIAMLIQRTQIWWVQLSVAILCVIYLVLIHVLPNHVQKLSTVYLVSQALSLYINFTITIAAIKRADFIKSGTPIEYYLQGFMFGSYIFVFMHCMQNMRAQILFLISVMLIAVFYSELFSIDWALGVRILMLTIISGGIIYIKKLYQRVLYLLNCHSLKMLNRLRNIINTDLPNAIIVLENDEQQSMKSLFHNRAFDKLFQCESQSDDECQGILQRLTLQDQPSLTVIEYIKQRMVFNASFQNPQQILGLQHDNNIDREFFQLQNCALQIEKKADAYSQNSLIKYIDVKCIRAFWEEKESFVLIMDDSSKRLNELKELEKNIAAEVFGHFVPRLKTLHKLLESSASNFHQLKETARQNLQFFDVIQTAFEQINNQSSELGVNQIDDNLPQSAKLQSSDSLNSGNFGGTDVQVSLKRQNNEIQIQPSVLQINKYSDSSKEKHIFCTEDKKLQPNRRHFTNNSPFFTLKHLNRRLQILFTNEGDQGAATQSQNQSDTSNTTLKVFSEKNLIIYNDENKVVALIALCVDNLMKISQNGQKQFDVNIQSSQNILHVCICQARLSQGQRDSHLNSQTELDYSVSQKILMQNSRETQNQVLKLLCLSILAQIGPQLQNLVLSNNNDQSIEFMIYNDTKNGKQYEADAQEQTQQSPEIQVPTHKLVKEKCKALSSSVDDLQANQSEEQEEIAEERKDGEKSYQMNSQESKTQSFCHSRERRQGILQSYQQQKQQIISDLQSNSVQLSCSNEEQRRSIIHQNQQAPQSRRQKNQAIRREALSFSKIRDILSQEGSIMQQPGVSNAKNNPKNNRQSSEIKKVSRNIVNPKKSLRGDESEEEDSFNFCQIQK